jgi:hypothetical protein
MPVAKSFQTFEQLCEPYSTSGKMYIQVKNPKTGTIRTVRWYTEKEYAKMYPSEISVTTKKVKTQKEVLGFEKGYITIFKGDTYPCLEWFQEKEECRYTRWWGWYIMSTLEIPSDIPEGIEIVQLPWELVGKEDGSLKIESEVTAAVETLIYDQGTSEYIGAIGDRLELEVTITGNFKVENGFGGTTTIHTMEDLDGNVYMWATSSKNWAVGEEKLIRGTVKEHRIYKNVKQTVLTRCAERG